MKLTLSVMVDEGLNQQLRAEAARQKRPLSWVAAEALSLGLRALDQRARKSAKQTNSP